MYQTPHNLGVASSLSVYIATMGQDIKKASQENKIYLQGYVADPLVAACATIASE